MKQKFIVEIITDGMDTARDMEKIAEALAQKVPEVVRPYVHETAVPTVRWVVPTPKKP